MEELLQFATIVLVVLTISAPSLAFVAWLLARSRKKKLAGMSFRNRVRSGLITTAIALGACVAVGVASRALERSSESGLLITLSMLAAYAYYLFSVVVVVTMVIFATALLFSIAREQKA